MHRGVRIVLGVASLVLVVGVGVALAQRTDPGPAAPAQLAASQEPEASVDPASISRAAERLEASGIVVDEAQLDELAATYGVGGAVRLSAWSDASGLTIDELRAMRDEGLGWGQIARDLGLHPGIGRIMGNGAGGGPADPPGGPPVRTPDD